jgi:hypothetical protein
MEILYRRRRAAVEDIRSELPDAPSPSSVRQPLEWVYGVRSIHARPLRYEQPIC